MKEYFITDLNNSRYKLVKPIKYLYNEIERIAEIEELEIYSDLMFYETDLKYQILDLYEIFNKENIHNTLISMKNYLNEHIKRN